MNHTSTHLPRRLRLSIALAGLGAAALFAGCATPQDQKATAAPAAAAASAPATSVTAVTAPVPAQATPVADMQPPRGAPKDRMALRHDRQMANLKAALAITPAQEGAWDQFEAAMPPPAPLQRPEPGQWAKLTTPERIERMDQLMADHQQRLKQIGDAANVLYAQLTPAQQKIFDDRAMRTWNLYGGQGRPKMHGKPVGRPAAPVR